MQAQNLSVPLTNANQEYSQVLPEGTFHFTVQARTPADVRFAYATGKVAAPTEPYATMKAGGAYTESFLGDERLRPNEVTLYLASGTPGVVVEIVLWTQ
jgi:hypothetical protein